MLHCNMNTTSALLLGLDDLLADLHYARRRDDVGRLALLSYCEVRRWARQAHEADIALHSAAMVTDVPHASRADFLEQVDRLIVELEAAHARLLEAEGQGQGGKAGAPMPPAAPPAPGPAPDPRSN